MSNHYGNMPVASARNGNLVFCVDAAMIPSATTFTGTDAMQGLTLWTTGIGGITDWGGNGATSENSRVIRNDPWGNRAILWRAFNNDAASGADGGWNSSTFSITNSSLYRWVRYFKVDTPGSNGSFYAGNSGSGASVLQWNNRAAQGNPYDYCPGRDQFTEDIWYVAISYMFPVGTAAGGGGSPYTTDYGFYPMNTGVRSTSGFGCNTGGGTIFDTNTTGTSDRQYLYYSTDPAVDLYWARPRCYLVNGSEPSISQIIAGEQNVWMDVTGSPTNMYAFNNPVLTRDTNGGYFDFNGSSTYFQGRDNTALNATTGLTMQAWVNSDNNSQSGFIFEKGTVNTQYSMFLSSNLLYFRSYGHSGGGHDLTFASTSVCPSGTWALVTCTYDGSNKRIYKNGTQVTSSAATGTLSTNTGGAWIGAYGGATPSVVNYPWDGKIASVRVYDTALSAAEIKNNFDSQRNRFGV
jgi:hypothetical protein